MGGAGGIERAYGREQKRWQCFAYLVLPLCHDPSPVVCGHLHCPEVLVLHPLIKSRLLSLLLLLALALLPLPAGRSVDAATLYTVLTDANFLSAAPGFDQDSIQQVLERVKSPLAGYEEVVGDDRFSAARSFYSASISRDDSLNPQVLLAILHASGFIHVSAASTFYTFTTGNRRPTLAGVPRPPVWRTQPCIGGRTAIEHWRGNQRRHLRAGPVLCCPFSQSG
jgi:hypothetical protein